MRKTILLLAGVATILSPAAAQQLPQSPYQQRSPGRTLNPRDVAEAQRDYAAMVQEFGGAETGPRTAYVDNVGHRVGAFSGIANSRRALRFTTLNSPVENAFSIPGGHVFITRQLMTLMNDESELAFALGHEVAHIADNHAHIREAYAKRNPLGVFGQILGAMMGPMFGQMLNNRAKLDTLRFSREQEYQADTLGRRYMIAAGYDPAGAAGVLAALSRNSALQARMQGQSTRQTPEWAQTHPLSTNRLQRELAEARATGRVGVGLRNRDAFLRAIEGVYVDDDPAQGIIDGTSFTHPDLGMQFVVPAGFLMSNGTRAVTISGSAGRAQFGGGQFNGPLDAYIMEVYRELTRGQMQIQIPPPQRITINGLPAAVASTRVRSNQGVIDASVVAYQWEPGRIYHFVMVTQGGVGVGPFTAMINSLRKITPQEAAAIRPRVLRVVTVVPGDTVQRLAARMAYRDFQLERFLSLNRLQATTRLVPGQKLKLVVYGTRQA